MTGAKPLYQTIEADLRRRIERGEFVKGAKLPSERMLCERYSVSSITIKRAIAELALDGLLETSRGRQARVVSRVAATQSGASVEGLIEGVLQQSLTTKYRVISVRTITAPKQVAAALRLSKRSRVYRAATLATRNGGPFAHTVSYVPETLGLVFTRVQLQEKPMLLLLDEAGVEMDHGAQFLGARPASPDSAFLLEIPPKTPLVHIHRTLYDKRGHGVEHVVAQFPWNRYEYEIQLSDLHGEKVLRRSKRPKPLLPR